MDNIRASVETAVEETIEEAEEISDTDDWTFISQLSSPSAKAKLQDDSLVQLKENNTPERVPETDARKTKMTPVPKSQEPFKQQRQQQQQQPETKNEDSVSIYGGDADDESDGMMEINLSDDRGSKIEPIAKRIKTTAPSLPCVQTYVREPLPKLDCCNLQREWADADAKLIADPVESLHSQSSSEVSENEEQEFDLFGYNELTDVEGPRFSRLRQACAQVNEVFHRHQTRGTLPQCQTYSVLLMILGSAIFMKYISDTPRNEVQQKQNLDTSGKNFDHLYLDPSNHAFTELKLLDEEMIDCIRRESPNIEEIEKWLSGSKQLEHDYNSALKFKPFKGLVCYENELAWRKKFNRLKTEHNLDLAKILKQVRRQLTYEMLEQKHPALRFKLIINQLEYLDYVDQRRKDSFIERLKAKNYELSRQVKESPFEVAEHEGSSHEVDRHKRKSSYHKKEHHQARITSNSLVSLESEINLLRNENEALRRSLTERAGTIYIKKANELDKCERENHALRRRCRL